MQILPALLAAVSSLPAVFAGPAATGAGSISSHHLHSNPPFANSSTSTSTTLEPTGSGFDYATRCEALIRAQSSSVSEYQSLHGSDVVTTLSNTITWTRTPRAQSAPTRLVTLCDGHPRVVGSVVTSVGKPETLTTSWFNTNTNFEYATSYTKPPPCSIGYKDCMSLWETWTTKSRSLVQTVSAYRLPDEPPCDNPKTSVSYTWSTGPSGYCDNCLIMASTARLLYWPVTTATGSSYDLCSNRAGTIAATPTGHGPNTFVTDNLTITSPTVAISFAMLSRADGCGPTMTSTVVPVRPDEVSSVRGYRVFFSHLPFNYADLNMECLGNSTDPDNCFTAVPAAAYFGGLNRDAALEGDYEGLTIFNDYKPQMLMPRTMDSGILNVWGNNCYVHPDGVWDPPIALQQAQTIVLPSVPSFASAQATSNPTANVDDPTAQAHESPSTYASPAGSHHTLYSTPTSQAHQGQKYEQQPASSGHDRTSAQLLPSPTTTSTAQLRINGQGDRVYEVGGATLTQIASSDHQIVLAHRQKFVTLDEGDAVNWNGQMLSAAPGNMLIIAPGDHPGSSSANSPRPNSAAEGSGGSGDEDGDRETSPPAPVLVSGTHTYSLPNSAAEGSGGSGDKGGDLTTFPPVPVLVPGSETYSLPNSAAEGSDGSGDKGGDRETSPPAPVIVSGTRKYSLQNSEAEGSGGSGDKGGDRKTSPPAPVLVSGTHTYSLHATSDGHYEYVESGHTLTISRDGQAGYSVPTASTDGAGKPFSSGAGDEASKHGAPDGTSYDEGTDGSQTANDAGKGGAEGPLASDSAGSLKTDVNGAEHQSTAGQSAIGTVMTRSATISSDAINSQTNANEHQSTAGQNELAPVMAGSATGSATVSSDTVHPQTNDDASSRYEVTSATTNVESNGAQATGQVGSGNTSASGVAQLSVSFLHILVAISICLTLGGIAP